MKTDPNTIYRHGQAMQIIMDIERAIERRHAALTCLELDEEAVQDVRLLMREIEDVWEYQLRPMFESLKKHIRSVLPK